MLEGRKCKVCSDYAEPGYNYCREHVVLRHVLAREIKRLKRVIKKKDRELKRLRMAGHN